MGVLINGWTRSPVVAQWREVVVTPPTWEPLTVKQLKDRARIKHNVEDGLLAGYIRSAREQVERDSSLALATPVRDLFFSGYTLGVSQRLPVGPLQGDPVVQYYDTDNVLQVIDDSNYWIESSSYFPEIYLADSGAWPADTRVHRPFVVRATVGWTAPELIPSMLVDAVALLAIHSATAGRDRFSGLGMGLGTLRDEYVEKLAPFRPVVVP